MFALGGNIERIEELQPGLSFQFRGRRPYPYHASGHRIRAINGNNFHHLARVSLDACLYSYVYPVNVSDALAAPSPSILLLHIHDYSYFCDPALGAAMDRVWESGHGG